MDGHSAPVRTAGLIVAVTLALLGCTAPTTSPSLTPIATPPATRAPTPSETPATRPTTTPPPTATSSELSFPATSEIPLMPGRYRSSPPFDIAFTFGIPDAGWESAHLLGEFFDILKFEDQTAAAAGQPSRWIAFAHPTNIRRTQATPAEDLSPDEAAALFADRPDLQAGATTAFQLDGLAGVRLDLHARSSSTPVFGGPAGNFAIGPENALRLGIVPLADDLLLALVLATPDELEAAWLEARPILESVDL
jgi:hypothetical protein